MFSRGCLARGGRWYRELSKSFCMCNLLEWDDDGEKLQVACFVAFTRIFPWNENEFETRTEDDFSLALLFYDCVQEVKLLIKLVSGVNKNKRRSLFLTFLLRRRLSYSSLVSSIIKRTRERQTKDENINLQSLYIKYLIMDN